MTSESRSRVKYELHTERAAWTDGPDGVIVLDLEDSSYSALNSTAAVMWRLLAAQPSDVEQLAAALLAEYEVEGETAHADAIAFVDALLERGFAAPT